VKNAVDSYYFNQPFRYNYLISLQWKLSNHAISWLNITSFGFCCIHKNWSHQTNV